MSVREDRWPAEGQSFAKGSAQVTAPLQAASTRLVVKHRSLLASRLEGAEDDNWC